MGGLRTTLVGAVLIALVVAFGLYLLSFRLTTLLFIAVCVAFVAAILLHAVSEAVAVVSADDVDADVKR